VPAATAKKEKKKKFNALSADSRELCYGGLTKKREKYIGGGNWRPRHQSMAIDVRAESKKAE
jgi:hypothetical protein